MLTTRFGAEKVVHSDVLGIERDARVSVVANLCEPPDDLAWGSYDCIVFTQTLQFVADPSAALSTLALAPQRGRALATFPGISQISRYDADRWGDRWRLTTLAARELFQDEYWDASVEAFGSALTAVGLLHGLVVEDLPLGLVDEHDQDYEVLVAARAVGDSQHLCSGALADRCDSAAHRSAGGRRVPLYHRISMGFDPLELNVSPHHFAEHMEVIARWTIPWSLRDLDRRVRDRSSRGHSWQSRSTTDIATPHGRCPALERSGIYATVFVTPGAQSGVREMWWDELTRLVMGWAAADIDEAWTLSRADDPTPSHARYRQLFDDLRRAPVASRDTILARLRAGDGLDSPARHPLLERDEIAKLDASPAIEVGAHTMTHPVLSALRPSQQFEEIAASRAGLEVILGRPPTSFAYPFGRPPTTIEALFALLLARVSFSDVQTLRPSSVTARRA